MKVKVRDKFYDSLNEPIMLILNDKDKVKIMEMDESTNQYCVHPDFMKKAEVMRFIKGEDDV